MPEVRSWASRTWSGGGAEGARAAPGQNLMSLKMSHVQHVDAARATVLCKDQTGCKAARLYSRVGDGSCGHARFRGLGLQEPRVSAGARG